MREVELHVGRSPSEMTCTLHYVNIDIALQNPHAPSQPLRQPAHGPTGRAPAARCYIFLDAPMLHLNPPNRNAPNPCISFTLWMLHFRNIACLGSQ
jgi:hypothetical protein